LGEAAPLALLLEAQVDHVTGAREIPLRLELAALLEGPLERPTDALAHLRRVLESAPGHAEALSRALAVAERTGEHETHARLLEEAIRHAPTDGERAALRTRCGVLLAGPLARSDEAITCFEAALTEDPARDDALAALRAQREARGEWPAVLACIEQQAARVTPSDAARAEALLREGATLAAERMGGEAALPWLERVAVRCPDDAEILERMAALHRAAERFLPLRDVIERQLALATADAERVRLLLALGDLLAGPLATPLAACTHLEEARRIAPDDAAPLASLDRLYEEVGRDADRLEVLEARIERSEPTERRALQRTAARLARTVGRELEATRHLEAALAAPGGTTLERVEGLRELAELWHALGRVDRAVEAAEAELEALDPEAEVFAERRRALRYELARTSARELGRTDVATAHLCALLDRENESGERLDDVEALLFELLRGTGDCVELERRMATRLERRDADADSDTEDWLELARLRREALRRPVAAAEAYRAVLRVVPDQLEALRGLRACCELVGEHAQVASTLDRELELRAEAEPSERAALLRRLGTVAWRKLEEASRARNAFAAALELATEDLVSLRALEELAEGMEDWQGAAALCERELEVLGGDDTARRRTVLLRIAHLGRERTEDPERALTAFRDADAISTLDPASLAAWASTHAALDQQEAFAEIFGRWIDAPGAAVALSDRLRLSDLLAELRRPEDALARAEQAAERESESAAAWDRVAALREQLGRAEAAAEALVRSASCHAGREAAVRRLGAAELVLADSPEQAASWLAEAIENDPALAPAHARLAVASATLGRLAVAERAAVQALGLPVEDVDALPVPLRLETALAGARAAWAQEHFAAAADLLGEVLRLDPDQAEALSSLSELRLHAGDAAAARELLVRRLALDVPDPDRALHL
ncbi:MAG: tetratricopeptide repeat protein, partial [Myxococcota bacterium]